jgi:hypothetical protein
MPHISLPPVTPKYRFRRPTGLVDTFASGLQGIAGSQPTARQPSVAILAQGRN